MDFSETPAAQVDTRKPQWKDFIGEKIRIREGKRITKNRKDGVRYAAWDLTFDCMRAGQVVRYRLDCSAYGVDVQLCSIMTQGGYIDPKWLTGGGLICRVIADGTSSKLESVKDAPETPQEPQGETA